MFAATPIIVVSAVYKGWEHARTVQETHGADAFVEKPFDVHYLRQLAARMIGRELPRLLQDAGIAVTRLAAYRTVAVEPSALHEAVATLQAEAVDLVPLGSPRTAQVLMLALGDDAQRLLSRTLVGAIGQTTTKALRDREIQVDVVAESPSFEDLVSQLALRRQQR